MFNGILDAMDRMLPGPASGVWSDHGGPGEPTPVTPPAEPPGPPPAATAGTPINQLIPPPANYRAAVTALTYKAGTTPPPPQRFGE